ncbi:MAG: DUF4177 domain-containing protein [Pseudoxanthomonas sp.]|nr:DUF4177 domain-containing protein [Pseudoxanthomonas sp.]
MKRWQYRTIELKPTLLGGLPRDLDAILNREGAQGWELVNMLRGTRVVLVFKREH